ncbi:aminoglycoside phosphotransferase [Streptomyces sp. NPDC096354]|uniref:aminoglycoside phosphotransferase n=1 Tax=Streptomyces sp. NPDC096354 TaxID=3366088 RepID=UPI00380E6FEB
MTDSTRLPSTLVLWVESVLGLLQAVHDASHPRENSRVWKVTGQGRDHYVKVAPKPVLYTRETRAHREAVPHLGHGNAPALKESSADLLALILTAVDGEPLKGEESSSGYGRSLSDVEDRALAAFAAADAAGALAYGPRHGDAFVTARGRRTVERLMREGRP